MTNEGLHNAIIFAALKHAGQTRKGTDIPYITHPMEVMQILTAERCSKRVIIAGILHDTLEDTGTKPEEIEAAFGKEVLDIAQSESEDKSKTWKERKRAAVDHLDGASIEVKLVCCADKLANLRSMYADRITVGDELWKRFNAGKDDIQWYYVSIAEKLRDDLADCGMFKELSELTAEVFD